jgi:hypothetical protein
MRKKISLIYNYKIFCNYNTTPDYMLIKIISAVVGSLMIAASVASIAYPYLCGYINTCPPSPPREISNNNNTNDTQQVLVNSTGFGVPLANFTENIECSTFVKSINFTYGKYVDSIIVNCEDDVVKRFGGNGGNRTKLIENTNGIGNISIIHGRVVDFIYETDQGPPPGRFLDRTPSIVCEGTSIIKNIYVVYGVFIDYLKFTCMTSKIKE